MTTLWNQIRFCERSRWSSGGMVRIAASVAPARKAAGFVCAFDVEAGYLERCAVQQVGGRDVMELCVPAEELEKFNAYIVGGIRMIAGYDTVRD